VYGENGVGTKNVVITRGTSDHRVVYIKKTGLKTQAELHCGADVVVAHLHPQIDMQRNNIDTDACTQ